VDELDPFQHLQPEHQGRLEGEPPPTGNQQLLEVPPLLLKGQVQPALELEDLLDLQKAVADGLLDCTVDLELVLEGVDVVQGV
jgi:hypothetical protein